MDNKKRAQFKILITHHITAITLDIDNLRELIKPVKPDNAIGRVSRMEAINEQSVNKANLLKAEKRLEQLNKALDRVITEDYGFCLRCEEELQVKRLEVLPESQICMTCFNKPPE